ncbi:hypothetical protein RI129_001135 [Pyrocoelia pectoralis]|uniref:Zinc finger CCCH-type with G patch domain-containing protein n=1 Tax=Pyrocoelia pectoralis TaxID=417401 RepID=A0AAN7ZWX1_9COLE
MNAENDILQAIDTYKTQLVEVEVALASTDEESQKAELESLRDNIRQLIELTEETLHRSTIPQSNGNNNDPFENEFALFMAEMEREGATNVTSKNGNVVNIENDLKNLEGMKCRAPHKHNWGDVMYHNAMVCSVLLDEGEQHSFEEIKVKIMFINPTHQEMLPCPYLMEGDCKFDDEQCKYSHGEIVLFSTLKEYNEPNFELSVGSIVLAKQIDKLWGRAKIIKVTGENCIVQFESSKKNLKLQLHEVLPLDSDGEEDISDDDDYSEREDVINMSLLNTPGNQVFGDWEKYTRGIGSKLMHKMGYIIGTGLGRYSDGRTEPVPAVVLPPGKSLDHCMNLREKAGGDKDLFNVEKKLKRLAKKQEKKNLKAYEREKKKVNVFNFLNETLAGKSSAPTTSVSKSKHRQEIKTETSRSLNVASLKIDEDIKRVERDLIKIKESLCRQSDSHSQVHKGLKLKLSAKQRELQTLKMKAVNIASEQSLRSDKKKMTVF